jgi:hypothetical protein
LATWRRSGVGSASGGDRDSCRVLVGDLLHGFGSPLAGFAMAESRLEASASTGADGGGETVIHVKIGQTGSDRKGEDLGDGG